MRGRPGSLRRTCRGRRIFGQAGAQGGRININTADEKELDSLPGVGPSTAKRIIEYRETEGSFQKPEDIKKVKGIGAGFIPETYSSEYIDEVLDIQNDDAIKAGRDLAQTEGLLVGISSGAAAFAATEIAKRPENKGKKIVALLPDTGERYLSTVLYAFEEYPL